MPMKLTVAGGCGEYGRNCFLVECGESAFLVDCGLMEADTASPYPRLLPEQIRRAKWLFLSHSHRDHAGGYAWLRAQGFRGHVVATGETLRQTGIESRDIVVVNRIDKPRPERTLNMKLSYSWGRSGHCAGSVWYGIRFFDKRILFSGDYIENSMAYACDPIRGQTADLAVLDSAYGPDRTTHGEYRANVLRQLDELLRLHGLVLLPVPLFGRGMDLLLLAIREFPGHPLYLDEHLRRELEHITDTWFWYRQESIPLLRGLAYRSIEEWSPGKKVILFLADTHLKRDSSRKIAGDIVSSGGKIMVTGTPDPNSCAEQLVKEGNAVYARYAVHSSDRSRTLLEEENAFASVLPFHSKESANPGSVEI